MSTSTPSPTPYNYSLQSIPAAFLFSLVPHSYGLARLMIATRNQMSNAMYVASRFLIPQPQVFPQ